MSNYLKLGVMEKISADFLSGLQVDSKSLADFGPIFYNSKRDFIPFEQLALMRNFSRSNDNLLIDTWISRFYPDGIPYVPINFVPTVRWMPKYDFNKLGKSLVATMFYGKNYETYWRPALVANSFSVRKLLIWISSEQEWAHFTIEPRNEKSFDMDLAFCQFLRAWFPWD